MLTLGITGNVVQVTATFKQILAGVLTTKDPDGAVVFTARIADANPDLVETFGVSGNITRDSAGVYHRVYVCSVPGEYIINVASGTGNGQAAEDVLFTIAPSELFS